MKVSLDPDVVLEPLLGDLANIKNLNFKYDFSNDLKKQEIEFNGKINGKEIHKLALKHIDSIYDFISLDVKFLDNYRGLRQLIILLMINYFINDK